MFKMVFKLDTGSFLPGEFAISFSSDLKTMLPELTILFHRASHQFSMELTDCSLPGLNAQLADDLVEFLMHVKDSVSKTISTAVDGWEARAKLLLPILSIFEDGEIAIPYLDSDTMSVMDLAFRTEKRKVLLKIELPSGYPKDLPKVSYFMKKIQTEGSRQTRGSDDMISRELPYSKNAAYVNEENMVATLMKTIAKFIDCDNE